MTGNSSKAAAATFWLDGKDYRIIDHGFDRPRALTEAWSAARVHAIKLAGVAGSVWPSKYETFIVIVKEVLLTELIAFSIHARRVIELEERWGLEIKGILYKLEPESRNCEYETNMWNALNKILHARELKVVSVDCEPQKFASMGDHRLLHVHVQSDKGPAILVCPSAIVFSFLADQS